MPHLRTVLTRLIAAPAGGKLRGVLLFPLTVISFFYGRAVKTRVLLYRAGICKTHTLPCKVVSVGNITLGGTGKTPFVILLAEMIRDQGLRAAVLSRGYGGIFQGDAGLVSDGERLLMNAREAGDEPYLLAEKLRGTPVLVGKKRRITGRWAVDRFGVEVVLLDDGFQHLPLRRDLNLLLVDSSLPFGNGKLFPRGVLREPLDQIGRADAIILTKAGGGVSIGNLEKEISNLAAAAPVFRVDYSPAAVRVPGAETLLPPEILRGKKILAFAGIARPESLERTLLDLGAAIVGYEIFPDHHEYRPKDLARVRERASRTEAEALVTTEKDLVRLMPFAPFSGLPVWALSVRHVFQGEDRPRFEKFLRERLVLET